MPDSIDKINLSELDSSWANQITDSSLFLIQISGTDYKLEFNELFGRTMSDLKSSAHNFNWNASSLSGIPVNTSNTEDGQVLTYLDSENAYVPITLTPSFINWSTSITDTDFLKLDASGNLTSTEIRIRDLKPNDPLQADKFLRVNSDGTEILFYDFDFELDLLKVVGDNIVDLDNVLSGHHKVGAATLGRPQNHIGHALTASSNEFSEASQLFLGTDSDVLRYRRHDGVAFQDWITVYNNSENPLSDSIDLNDGTRIATSTAVYDLNAKVDELTVPLTPLEILDKIKVVHGTGSGLDSDYLDGFSSEQFSTLFRNMDALNVPEFTVTFNNTLKQFERSEASTWVPLELNGELITPATQIARGAVRVATNTESREGLATDAVVPPAGIRAFIEQYGLGLGHDVISAATTVNNLSAATVTGFYSITSDATDSPFSVPSGMIVLRTGSNNRLHQLVFEGGGTRIQFRHFNGTVWSEWHSILSNLGIIGERITLADTATEVRDLIELSSSDTVSFQEVNIAGFTAYHQGNLPITASRESTATGTVINAKGMNDHRLSGDHDTRYYTQAQVDEQIDEQIAMAVPSGIISMWSGAASAIPSGYALCDGTNGTPDLRNRFIVGAGSAYGVNETGGSANAVLPAHTHAASTGSAGNHSHSGTTVSNGSHKHIVPIRMSNSNIRLASLWNSGYGSTGTSSGRAVTHTNNVYTRHYPHTNATGAHTHGFVTNTVSAHTHSIAVSTAGESSTGKNLPPYYALAYIMKM